MVPDVTWFSPQPPDASVLLASFPSPFDELGPALLARCAAEEVQASFRHSGEVAPGVPAADLFAGAGGKMFGVLVVRDSGGRVGYLRAFSGMLAGSWRHPGYVGPAFDELARAAVEAPGEAVVKDLLARFESLHSSEERRSLLAEQAAQEARHGRESAELRARHEERRRQRHAARDQLGSATRSGDDGSLGPSAGRDQVPREGRPAPAAALHALDQQSRADKAERRRLEASHDAERASLAPRLRRMDRRLRALERLRHFVCRRVMQRLHDAYRLRNARGETRPLRALFAHGEPPSGAGDCAAPKLLAAAYAAGLRPLALAEFWWGAPPVSGGRASGGFYPACRNKCGPLLPFMLEGLTVSPPRRFVPAPAAHDPLPVIYEDQHLAVVEKPAGLLSVPGKGEALADSVQRRLRARFPHATGPLIVHRLDLDTSGLLVVALSVEAHRALQRQFLRREVTKRYAAWLDGLIAGDAGTIELPLRVDLEDRPRQIHDPVHGKAALTEWRVIARQDGRTRVALSPKTGRTHQLRVHAAHPLGLGAPIVGDRLYGRPAERLLLHAEALAFAHPVTGAPLAFERPAPF